MPRLVLEGSEATCELVPGRTSEVGRLASCDLTLQEPQSSRKHFQIESRGCRWWVVDLGSRNGTYLNEERLSQPIALRHGDKIRVGESVVRYESAETPLPKGTKLGSVVIDAAQGRSHWGTLYAGKQGALERDVCVEVVDPDLAADPALRESYQRRARAAGAFEHPVVRAVFDTSSAGEKLFTVFESFPGLTLEERLVGAGPLGREQAFSVLAQVADALAHVHARGKVHGLLSSRAVLVDGQARAKLVDLGEEPAARLATHQADGLLVTSYASPEEARGDPPAAASDVHALGLLACRLLLGRLPWKATKKRDELLSEIAIPGPRDLEGADPALQSALDALLAPDPAARPSAAQAAGLLTDLSESGAAAAPIPLKRKKEGKERRISSDDGLKSPRARASSEDLVEKPRAKDSAAVRRENDEAAERRALVSSDVTDRPRDSNSETAASGRGGARPRDSAAVRRQRAAGGTEVADPAAEPRATPQKLPTGPPPLARARVSDRLAGPPEPAWFLPARLLVLGLGYGLIFAAAALLVRLAARAL